MSMSDGSSPNDSVSEIPATDVETFDERLDGDLILPDHDAYDDARDVWNGLVDKHPAVIVRVRHAEDVAASLEFADRYDFDLSIRGNAHHQAGSALVEDGLVVDLADLTAVDVDSGARRVTVGAGATAGAALERTLEHGLAFPTGSASVVGLSGSTLGGGLGWMRRKHGAGFDALREVDLVTADGTVRTVSPDDDPDLFWAICGAGANFGVVTALTFELYETQPVVPALGVFYPRDDAEAVLEGFRELATEAPDALSTMLLNTHVPPLPDVPEDLQGTPSIAIMGAYLGDPDAAAQVLDPYRALGDPILDMSGEMPYMALHELGAEMFPDGHLYSQRSVFLDELTDDHLDLIRTGTDDAPSPLDGIGLWTTGGAIGDSDHATAAPWTDKEYLLVIEGQWVDPEATDQNLEWVRRREREARDIGGEYAYPGYVGYEQQDNEDWAKLVYGKNYDRLAELKAIYDPDNRFRTNINVVPRT
ncbi:FAD/FMN-containing dehydrogenase fused to Heterodisulfide reductase, subunit B [Halapricum desulfuricans]|uniref:FAD/FMN-containing dehydrogenase fused to Heterodisulfide reductase, subunit B n=2 Tax=Halapricum desulfuricans TaxID=2841257 RepID=A0A897NGG3_9EURY|nr:FAD/FMN-containing dehydrogenase fused to Heterodisulfide reductase, subunit B [Halapricum desulfuricans]